jgi:hypothetical protein
VDDVLAVEQRVVGRHRFPGRVAVEHVGPQRQFPGQDPLAEGPTVDDPGPGGEHDERSGVERPRERVDRALGLRVGGIRGANTSASATSATNGPGGPARWKQGSSAYGP